MAVRNSTFSNYNGIAAPAVSAAGDGRIYFDSTSNIFMASENGGAYVPLIGAGGGGGWTDDGTVVRLTTVTDQVGMGTTSVPAGTKAVVRNDDASSAAVTVPLALEHTVTGGGVGAAGIGSGLLFRAVDAAATLVSACQINGFLFDVTAGAQEGGFIFRPVTAGVLSAGGVAIAQPTTAGAVPILVMLDDATNLNSQPLILIGSTTPAIGFGPGGGFAGDTRIQRLAAASLTFDDGASGAVSLLPGALGVGSIGSSAFRWGSVSLASYLEEGAGSGAAVSPAGAGRLRFNEVTNRFQVSENGGAYTDLGTSTSGAGWTDDGTNVRLTTSTDTVSIGTSVMPASTKALVAADVANQVPLRLRSNSADDDSSDSVLQIETSGGSSRARIDSRGHMSLASQTTQSSASLFSSKSPSSGTRWRGFWSRAITSGAVTTAGGTVIGGNTGDVRSNGAGSSDGTLTVGVEGVPPGGVFVASIMAALQESTGAHTGDFSGGFGFAGGSAAVALGTITRANGLAGQVGYNPDATSTGAITSGYALRALVPAGTAAGRTITTAAGVRVENQGATGVTNAIGVDIAAQSGASSSNLALRFAGDAQMSGDFDLAPATTGQGDLGTPTLRFARLAANAQYVSVASKVFADSPYAVTATDYVIEYNATGGASTVNLPALAGNLGRRIIVKKTDASINTVTVDGSGAETIDGAATRVLALQYQTAVLVAGPTEWLLE